jgi:hypothetical protein
MHTRHRSAPLALLLVTLAAPSAPAAGQAGAANRARCTAGTAAHPTIQSAVDDTGCRHIDVPAGTYSEDVSIGRDVTIRGARGRTFVKGGNIVGENTQVLLVQEGNVRLRGLTIQSDTQKRGITNNGTLRLEDCAVTGNYNDVAAGIANRGSLTLVRSIVARNIGRYFVGIANSGVLMVSNSTISDNENRSESGAGLGNTGVAFVQGSIIRNNRAATFGGGVFNDGQLVVRHSDISGNSAILGGGIYNCVAPDIPACEVGRAILIVKNSTVLGNEGGDIYPPLTGERR